MDEPVRTDLPRGFGGTVEGWHEIVPLEGRVLRLPHDAIQDGPSLRVPDGTFDTIFVEAFVEGLGNFERFVAQLAEQLAPGGRLLIDAEHCNGPQMLRRVLEGKRSNLDPAGSFWMPELPLGPQRMVAACEASGLLVEDVLRVPHPDRVSPRFVQSLIAHGYMASNLAGGAPAARHWLIASRNPIVSGTVVIGPGDGERQQRTRNCLSEFLPNDWRVVVANEATETEAINRAVATSAGATFWFLRAGSSPRETQFVELLGSSALGPTVPGGDDGPARAGDLNGLMVRRSDLMLLGPIDESWSLDAIAFEDFGMRCDACGKFLAFVGGLLDGPELEHPKVDLLQRESERLFERWEGVGASAEAAVELPPVEVPWEGREPRVSLCMITRDEERYLDECLRRAKPAVDEIVIVDTGSVDRTIEIARSHGATVVEERWQDDFAKPRNTGLDHVNGDWVLVLDADEMLDDGSAEAIRRLVEEPRASGYHVRFTNVFGGEKTLGVTMVRLFRNLPGLRWANRIHEQVTPSLLEAAADRNLSLLPALDVHVLHYGYQPEIMDARGKLERNERLFRLQLAEHPDDVYSLYKYGDFLRRCPGRDRDAREVLDRTLELILERFPTTPRGLPYAGEVAALCALEAAREEDYDRAEQIIETALRRFMVTPNLHYIAASIALRRGREDTAIAHYERCMSYRGQTLVVPIQDGITGHVSMTGIAQALLQKGDRVGARRMLEKALAIDPSHDVTTMVLSRLWLEEGDIQRALSVLTDYLNRYPESAGVCQQTSMLLAQLGYTDQAKRIGERAVALLEADASQIEANHMRKTLAALA
ncbi:MAG: glycosyltransferase [Planctomycetes bacterium]|nr:glycosyltransferase [Planctomycetota bacterium]